MPGEAHSNVGAMATLELGGNITLSGFSERDFTEMIVIKKIVGQYARRFTDSTPGFSKLSIILKGEFEISTTVTVDNREFSAHVTNQNLFVALDSSLKQATEHVHAKH
jgi:hypothetical protein